MLYALHYLTLASTLFLLWIALSMQFLPFYLTAGVAAIALVSMLAWKLRITGNPAHQTHALPLRMLLYWLWLIQEMIKSGLTVTRTIWLSPKTLHSRFFWVALKQPNPLARTIYANSITLTPGTVCVDVHGDYGYIHELDASMSEDVGENEMRTRIHKAVKKEKDA